MQYLKMFPRALICFSIFILNSADELNFAASTVNIECRYLDNYICYVDDQDVLEFGTWTLYGQHQPDMKNSDVTHINFYDSVMETLSREINENVARKFENVVLFTVEHSRLMTVTPGIFGRLVKLKVVRIAFNNIQRISAGIFNDLTQLEKLELIYNQIKTISGGAFQGLKNLNHIDLSGNYLEVLEENLFVDVKNLKNLHMSRNKLQVLRRGLFRENYKLRELLLEGNQISAVDQKFFQGTFGITLISFRFNPCFYSSVVFENRTFAMDGLDHGRASARALP